MRAHYISLKPKSKKIEVYRALAYANVIIFFANILFYRSLAGPEVFLTKAANVNVNAQLEIIATSAEAAPTPTPTPGVPGLAFPGLVLAPVTEEFIFLEREQGITPYIVVTRVAGRDVSAGELTRTYSREPQISGKTNLRLAHIFIQIQGFEKKAYTLFADAQGRWTWNFPVILEPGFQTLTLTAISSVNPYFQAENTFTFEVVEIPKEIPTPGAPPKIIPPVVTPQEPREREEVPQKIIPGRDVFSLRVKVSPFTKEVLPGEPLDISADIKRVSFIKYGEEVADVRYFVLNPDGEKVFEKTESILIQDELLLKKRLVTSLGLKPGEYLVQFEITRGDTAYISTDNFIAEERVLISIPGILRVTTETVSDALVRLSFVSILILVTMLGLLFWEYEKSKREKKIDEHDLYRERDII